MKLEPTFFDIAAVEAARKLVPEYDFMQKKPFLALELKKGDCKAVALIIAALRNGHTELVRQKVTTQGATGRPSSAYVHYLALDREAEVVMHSTGAPLHLPGAHIKAVHISDFNYGWSSEGENRAKPAFAKGMLKDICSGSNEENRTRGGYRLGMSVEDPSQYLDLSSLEELRDSAIELLRTE